MAEKIVLVTSIGDDDPNLSDLFEVAVYEVEHGAYGDNPLDEPETFTTYADAETHAKLLSDQHGCDWKNAWH